MFESAVLIVLILPLFSGCVEKKMALKEAKQVTVSMSEKSFVPPPRRIDDILAVLNQPGQFDADMVQKIKAEADASPPETNDRVWLAKFYGKRGNMAWQLGRYELAIEDNRRALAYAEEEKGQKVEGLPTGFYAQLLQWQGRDEIRIGNFRDGIAFLKQSDNVYPGCGNWSRLVASYIDIGDFKAAENAKNIGIRLCNQKTKGGKNGKYAYHRYEMESRILEAKGHFKKAEPYIRDMLNNSYERLKTGKKTGARDYLFTKSSLAKNLAHQGRLLEAEIEAREALKGAIGLSGKESELVADLLNTLARIMYRQGRFEDAEKLTNARIQIYKISGIAEDTKKMAGARFFLGQISVFREDFVTAMKHYDFVKESLLENKYLYNQNLARNPYLMISLLKTGRTEEAMELITSAYDINKKSFGEKDFHTANILALRGMANATMKNNKQAMEDFYRAVPILIENAVICKAPVRRILKSGRYPT